MSKGIKPEQLGDALSDLLGTYNDEVTEKVNDAGRKAGKKLVKLTKATAPVGYRGAFKKSIALKETDAGHRMKNFTWYVKPPNHRLTHLLVKGHATKDGGRTKADPFLANALDQVLPDYEKEVEEAVK